MGEVLGWRADTFEPHSDQPACIPPGVYELEYTGYHTGVIRGAPKVAILFRVVSFGKYFHTPLARYYHVKSFKRGGSFKAGWHSDLVREYARVLGEMPRRRDRIPIHRYRGLYILGRVYTVVKNSKQRQLPDPAHYSVVGELLNIKQ